MALSHWVCGIQQCDFVAFVVSFLQFLSRPEHAFAGPATVSRHAANHILRVPYLFAVYHRYKVRPLQNLFAEAAKEVAASS